MPGGVEDFGDCGLVGVGDDALDAAKAAASISSQSRLTWRLEMPSMPRALTRSSTERAEMPWT